MEILNATQKKRNLLLITDGSTLSKDLNTIFSKEYNVITADNQNRDFAGVKKQNGPISIAILPAYDACMDDFALFHWLETDTLLSSIPLVVYCNSEKDLEYGYLCLSHGAVDVITKPLNETLLLNHIKNAIRIKDSATFYEIERMLKELPSNIYLKDDEDRYIFATHYWHHLEHNDDPDWTIRGKTDVEIRKDRDNALKAMEADKKILETGVGTDYTIEINADGVQEFMQIIKQPVRDDNGKITGIIGLINNVTETELLRISLEKSAMIDDLTGVYNRHFYDTYCEKIVSDKILPICIISADCNGLKIINDTYGHLIGDEYLRLSAVLFKMVVGENGQIFRIGGDEFVIFLPGKTAEYGEYIVHNLKEEEKKFSVKGHSISISYGVSCLEEESQSLTDLFDLADKLMYSNKAAYKKALQNSKKS